MSCLLPWQEEAGLPATAACAATYHLPACLLGGEMPPAPATVPASLLPMPAARHHCTSPCLPTSLPLCLLEMKGGLGETSLFARGIKRGNQKEEKNLLYSPTLSPHSSLLWNLLPTIPSPYRHFSPTPHCCYTPLSSPTHSPASHLSPALGWRARTAHLRHACLLHTSPATTSCHHTACLPPVGLLTENLSLSLLSLLNGSQEGAA